jgi:hypothetical protein
MQEDRFFCRLVQNCQREEVVGRKTIKKYNCLTDFDIRKIINTNASAIIENP